TLESTLLEGDVTDDLVEDALVTYLQGLDVRARLEMVSLYLDQNLTDGSLSTMHVLGRTYAQPHKYFYRTYASGVWSAWDPVTVDIDGDHVVLAVWRGKLNLFWATFIPLAQGPQASSGSTSGPVGNLSFGDLTADVFSARAQSQYRIQLHWSEYFKGKWS